jgi:hypothetical protein
LAFLTQNKAKICKILIITLVFEKNANFFAENCQKSQKMVIITSTPGHPESDRLPIWVKKFWATSVVIAPAASQFWPLFLLLPKTFCAISR